MIKPLKIFLFLILMITFSSCNPGRIYEKHIKLNDYAWDKFETFTFEFEVDNISVEYDIYLAIRHAHIYPYDNLLVSTVMTTPSGEKRYTDYDLSIKDKNGEFLGDGMGDLWDINIPIRKKFKFQEKGKCVIEFENRMSRLRTPAILEVGLIVEASE
ncbi:gliding motility lipoprotein GldH [Bacteroidota bacterium]